MLRARAASRLRLDAADLGEICRRLDGATRAEHIDLAPGLTLLVRVDCDPTVRRLEQDIYAGYGPPRL